MSDETEVVEPTADDSSGTGDAIAAFVSEEDDAPEEREENQPIPRRAPEKKPERAAPKAKAAEDDEPAPADEPAAEKKSEPEKKPRTYKQKINGQDLELDADQVDALAEKLGLPAQEILGAASLKRAAYEKMREAAEGRKAIEHARELAQKDPARALSVLGLDPKEFDRIAAERTYARFAAEVNPTTGEPLTPEQRELAEFRAREQERQRAEQAAAEQAKAEEAKRVQQDQERHWTKVLVGHLEKTGDPKHLLPRVAAHLSDAIEHDVGTDPQDILEDAVAMTWEDLHAEHAKLYDAMPFETLKARLPTLIEKVRKGLVEEWKARSGQKAPERQPPAETTPRRDTGRRPRTTSEVMASFLSGR